MNRDWRNLLIKIVTDVFLVNLAFVSAFLLKFNTFSLMPVITIYYKLLFFVTILWLVVLNLAGLYKLQPERSGRVDNMFSVTFGAFSAAFFTYVMIVFIYREASYSKEIVVVGSLIAVVLINISRYLIWKLSQR